MRIPCMRKSIYTAQHERLLGLLKQIRLGAGLTQADLAARLDVPQPFVSRYESGQRRLDLLELRQICEAVGMSLADFVARFEKSLPCSLTPPSSTSPRSSGPTSARSARRSAMSNA